MKVIYSQAFEGLRTKKLVQSIPKRKIAILHHQDIDSTAAEGLIERKVKAVLNFKKSMTGSYEHDGVYQLLVNGIQVFDIVELYQNDTSMHEGIIKIIGNFIYMKDDKEWIRIARVYSYSFSHINQLKKVARLNFNSRFIDFAQNSLQYAKEEIPFFNSIDNNPFSWVADENVLIVVRGAKFEKDLVAVWPKIKRMRMKIIAVDGAADVLMKQGIVPDAIIGDMDSVSEDSLKKCSRLYAHCYLNGKSPGKDRIDNLNLLCKELSFVGTSEDIAIIFSFWANAKKIFLIGSHFSMNEFLDKDRKGMGSSLLVRMQASHKIVDLKGYHELKKDFTHMKSLKLPFAISLIPIAFNIGKVQLVFSFIYSFLKGGGG